MPYVGRNRLIERAFVTIKMLQRKGGTTAQQLAEATGMTRGNAWYYLNEASRLLPVYEANGEAREYHEAVIYKLMEE